MKTTVLRHTVPKSAEGRYFALPFTVPADADSLTVTCDYDRRAGDVIDLGLADGEGRFLGWSGSSRRSVTVGAFDATPGYRMQPVRAGTWQILVGAYHVSPGGTPVRYEITLHPAAPAWLFGDLHAHSDASDGALSVSALAQRARAAGLDFLAVTDHNNDVQNLSLPRVPGLTLIPGVEWTHYRGHMNFWGAAQPFGENFIANSPGEMRGVVREAKARGALVSVNHPKCTLCPYLWPDTDCFDTVEVWNGPMRPVNENAIRWWTALLGAGRRVAAVGGSDFHRPGAPARLGVPVTAVCAASRAPADILRAVAAGRSFVTGGVGGVLLDARCAGEGFGGTVRCAGAPPPLAVRAHRMPPGAVLRLVGPGGVLWQRRAHGGRVVAQVLLPPTPLVYLHAGYPLPAGGFYTLAVSNPVFFLPPA